jgi:hypothetical protein
MSRFYNASAFLIVPLLLFAWQDDSCRSNTVNKPPIKTQRVGAGIWGGQHITLNVIEDGATATMDCAHGTIKQPIELDDVGRFNVSGTFTSETPGPLRSGSEDSHPVRYAGTVKAGVMTLTITSTSSDELLGSFTLTQGQPGRIRKCL